MSLMTPSVLRELCREQGLYHTPPLNDRLYLHYKGWEGIASLEAYTGLRALYLEGNGLQRIEGLTCQAELRVLYLQENLLEEIEGLEGCPLLDTLNLCKNRISSLQTATLAPLAGSLRTLLLGHNELAAVEDLAPLACLLQLEVLDLQCNRLCDGAGTLRVLAALPRLAVLHLQGNPLVAATPHYRRSALGALTALAYLDERPVFPAERAGANAAERALRAGGGPEEAAAAEREALAADLAARREEERARSAAWGEFVRRAQAARGVAQEEKGAQRVSAGPEAQGCPSDEDSVELSTGAAEPGAFRDTGDARTRSLSAGEEVPALSTGDSTASMELSTRRDNGSRSLSPQASTAEQQGDKAHDAVATMTEALQGFAFKKGPGGSA